MEQIPTDLRAVFSKNAKAKAQWEGLTPIARRDFVTWIGQAKQPETRKRRVLSIPSRLASGKRRICCFSVVPLGLYSSLNQLPKAKKQWSTLSADEKRDFTDYVNAGKDKAEREARIGKVCARLLSGKRSPQ